MAIFKCKICGGGLEVDPSLTVAECQYCGTRQTLPRLDDERRANLYDRANHFRRNNDFDKAMGIYEQILNEDTTDAEAYWSLVLCRYGIEYVEDPATRRRVATVNRAQFTSIFDDEDYKSAIANADGAQREIYEAEAEAINEIQKGILAISQKEEPFDVFICYKETDSRGRRTQDSVLATELYHELVEAGFKVFFSRITLESKLGEAYEPYIFAALHSARVMVVLGTRPEHFNATWVKNEWGRYLALIKNGAKKTLIPAYRDMDPYDLPEEFSHLQAQDMSKLGFMQDLLHGIQKIAGAPQAKEAPRQAPPAPDKGRDIAPLLKRVFLFLEDGDFTSADEYCEKVLDRDPENARAYLGKLMAKWQVCRTEDLGRFDRPISGDPDYKKALRFADDAFKQTLLNYNNEIIYNKAAECALGQETPKAFTTAAEMFESIAGYKDATELAAECRENAETLRRDAYYKRAAENERTHTSRTLTKAAEQFEAIAGYKDATERAAHCRAEAERVRAKEEAALEAARRAEDRRVKRNRIIGISLAVLAVGFIVFWIIYSSVVLNVETENFVFEKEDDGYWLTDYTGTATTVEVPAEVRGKPVTRITANAFDGCKDILILSIPDSVTYIENGAFSECNKLQSVTLPFVGNDGNGSSDFECVFADTITLFGTANDVPSTLTKVTITGGKSIQRGAFAYCNSIEELTLPFIGGNADGSGNAQFVYIFNLDNGNDLSTDYIPYSLSAVHITGGNKIATSAFENCSDLKTITISGSIAYIDSYAFSCCTSLKTVTLSAPITRIGSHAFENCTALTSMALPDSVTEIGNNAFTNCEKLSNLSMSHAVTSIGSYAFSGCAFVTFVIPRETRFIGENAFRGCSNLQEITFTVPDGWKYYTSSGAAGTVAPISLATPTRAASLFTGSTYQYYIWRRN